jgi:hypothetical protein
VIYAASKFLLLRDMVIQEDRVLKVLSEAEGSSGEEGGPSLAHPLLK